MDPTLQVFFSSISALSVVIGIIVIIRKNGAQSGEDKASMKTVVENTNYIRTDLSQLKRDFGDMKVANATRDEAFKSDRDCLREIKNKVEDHADRIPRIEGAVETIQAGIKITPKRTKGDSL